jgi:hypothetical protein
MPYIYTAFGSIFFYFGSIGFPILWAGFGAGPFYEALSHQTRQNLKDQISMSAQSGAGYPEFSGHYSGAILHRNLSVEDSHILADRLASFGFGDFIVLAFISIGGAGISATISYKLAVFLAAKADKIAPSKTANPEL